MVIDFDIFGQAKTPTMTLHNPNGQQVGIVSEFKDMQLNPKLLELSTLSFSVPHNNLFLDELYDKLKKRRIVRVASFGDFMITNVREEMNGIVRWKHIECNSIEVELTQVTVKLLAGIYKFYDTINPSETVLGKVMEYLPNWEIGYVDSDLLNVKRLFDDTAETAYGILTDTVADTFSCKFIFNNKTRTIDVKKYGNIPKNTDIVAGYSNLVKNIEITEDEDSVFTCLNVLGNSGISINEVNPLGTSKLYNYDYYLMCKDNDGQYMMSEGLRSSVTKWKTKLATNEATYKTLINDIKAANGELISLNQTLTTLKNEYTTLETQYKVRTEQGLSVSEIRNQMYNKEIEIKNKETEIVNKETQVKNYVAQKVTINNDLSPNNVINFTLDQQKELAYFTIETEYSDPHLCVTDSMNEVEKMNVYQELYDKGVGILKEVSQPTYSFTTSLVNYLLLSEYQDFTRQTELGCVIRLEIEKGRFAYPILLGYSLTFDKNRCSNIDMDWGSSLRLANDKSSVEKLLDKAVSGGNKVSLDSYKWSLYGNDKSAINDYMNKSLDASLQNVVNADNQEIVFGANGIIGRKNNGDGTYSPEAFWMMNNTWIMTDNDFQTSKLAMGKILMPDGITKAYGLNTEILVGKLIVGNQLHIENESNTFRVDTNGATLLNADFTIENLRNKLLLSPNDGIKIQKKNGSLLEDVFSLNATTGDLLVKGTIHATSGSFTGDIKASTISGGEIKGTILTNGNNFKVDALGNVEARSIKILGGELDAANMNIKNLVVGENVTMGVGAVISWANVNNKPNDLAYLDDIPTTLDIQGIAGTTITDKLVSSPEIVGAKITGGRILQASPSSYFCGDVLLENGRMYLTDKSGGVMGLMTYNLTPDNRFNSKVYIQSNGVPLRLEAVNSNMALAATGKIYVDTELVISDKCTFLGEVYGCNVVFG